MVLVFTFQIYESIFKSTKKCNSLQNNYNTRGTTEVTIPYFESYFFLCNIRWEKKYICVVPRVQANR